MADTAVKEKTSIFGKKERRLLIDPLNDNNPLTVQVLGICSALAVTTLVSKAIVMSVAVVFVTAFASLIVSILRNAIPTQVRMIVQLVVIATLVTIVELVLKAFDYPLWKDLAVYIGLIITNCIVMGRLEAFSMANKPWRSFLDGIGNGLGYGVILIIVAIIKELFGKGTLLGFNIIGAGGLLNTDWSWMSWYANNNFLVLPVSSLFIVGVLIWIQRSRNTKLIDIS